MSRAAGAVPFYFVDVFAASPLTGNPVAVVPDADRLDRSQMQAIAREFNQSETAFILAPERPSATVRLRSFTPIGAEVFGAGHNALGCWLWLALAGLLPPETIEPGGAADGPAPAPAGAGEVSGIQPGGAARPGAARPGLAQQIGDDVLPVRVRREADGSVVVSMGQSPPQFGDIVTERAALADALGLTPGDLVADDPAQVVATGAGHLLVSLRDRAAVDRAVPQPAPLAAALALAGGEGCYIYTRERPAGADAAAYARFFNPAMGIAEDPATGTAAGPLAALLVRRGQLEAGPAVIEQGHALGRPSRIQVRVSGPSVTVSGSGLISAEGFLRL
jgi:trans-2,3-dihydro-3-hydroxyanthranilate isomerase